jgi:ubiquinone/menaquinone biosynthesis C-methylase UbiE
MHMEDRLRAASVDEFDPVERSLREAVRAFYERIGSPLEGPSGTNTLETNSGFVERGTQPLVELYARRAGGDVAGARVVDVGCGFGAMSVYLGVLGASVTGIDPNEQRLEVGRTVAAAHGLDVRFAAGRAEALALEDSAFDLAIMNNSLCYIVDRDQRRRALSEVRRVLRPGAWLIVRNPNRSHPVDQFTGMPLIGLLPPDAAVRASARLGRERSRVRLVTPGGARRELERAGFADVRHEALPGPGWKAALKRVARYQHLSGRRPELPHG